MDRKNLKKTAQETNDIGARLYFLRNKLKLKLVEVCRDTNIPPSSYCDRESGLRTCFYEELLILSLYYNTKWQFKFGKYNSYPTYKGYRS